jgi:hypothetical protein
MSSYKERLDELIEQASQINKGDLLMEVNSGLTFSVASKEELKFSTRNKILKQIVDQNRKEEKERGISPLCLADHLIQWKHGKNQIQTPILLHPCKATIDKISETIFIEIIEGQSFVNPVLLRVLKNEFELSLSDDPSTILDKLKNAGFEQIEPISLIGNFHHHRFDVLRDLEAIQSLPPHKTLLELLGETAEENTDELIELSDGLVEPSDPDQLDSLDSISLRHTVIQGPPGTGKSQVLTNLLAKILYSGKQALVVSEKRVALEVLVKKLRANHLDHFVFIATESMPSKEFLSELKENWLSLEKGRKFEFIPHDSSSALLGNLQLLLDTLNAPEAVGGISYTEFLCAARGIDLSRGSFDSALPSMKMWLKEEQIIERIYEGNLQQIVGSFHYGALRIEQLQQLDNILRELSNEFERLSALFRFQTWGELLNAMKLAAAAQYQSSDLYLRHSSLLKKYSPQQKKFLKLRKKYLKLSFELHQLHDNHDTNWLKKPSSEEVKMLENAFTRRGIFAKSRFKRKWAAYSPLPADHVLSLLNIRKKIIDVEYALTKCRQELFELGVEEPEVYLEIIFQQITDQAHLTDEQLNEWPVKKVTQLAHSNKALLDLHTQLKLVFQFKEERLIKELINNVLCHLSEIRPILTESPLISEQTHRVLVHYGSFEALQSSVFCTNYQQFLLRFPYLKDFQADDLLHKCEAIANAQSQESQVYSNKIQENQQRIFETYQQILRAPSSTLTAEQKAFKERLTKGKAILVKAFSKKRNLPTLRSVYQSEAIEWIRILKPIWLCNPSQAARIFPMEKNHFEFGIFDEGSQIPLENSLGTIYRSRRIVVAGDSQQMSPSSFFSVGANEKTDLLHQAGFHWKTVPLLHHYRSEHPGLIQFSNMHFYQSSLRAFPSANAEKKPVELHYVDGVYEDGVNIKEAQVLATMLDQSIHSDLTIGVVAFSQNQLETIRTHLSPNSKMLIEERIEQDTLFFKAIENVQGDECDVLLISVGYGKDKEGKFHMRFGPLNQSGGLKRLNVLFSRARKKIHVFASVKSSDFKLSSNEAVELLRRYIHAAENEEFKLVSDTFFQTHRMTRKGNELLIQSPQQSFPKAQDMVNLVRTSVQRGWNVKLDF